MTYSRLSFKHRREIESLLAQSVSRAEIARRLGVHRSTVSNEIKRNSWKGVYTAHIAQFLAEGRKLHEFSPLKRPLGGRRKGALAYKRFRKRSSRLVTYRKKRIRDFRFNFAPRPKRWKRYEWKMSLEAEFCRKRYLRSRERRHWMEGEDRRRREWVDWQFYHKTGRRIYNRKRPLRYTKEVLDPGKYFTKGIYHKHSKLERLSRSLRYSLRKLKISKIKWQGISKRYFYRQNPYRRRTESPTQWTHSTQRSVEIRPRLRTAAKSRSKASASMQPSVKKRSCIKVNQQAQTIRSVAFIFTASSNARRPELLWLMATNSDKQLLFWPQHKAIRLFSG